MLHSATASAAAAAAGRANAQIVTARPNSHCLFQLCAPCAKLLLPAPVCRTLKSVLCCARSHREGRPSGCHMQLR